MPFGQVNLVAALVAAVIAMVLGFLWYGPLFGQMWLRMIGRSQDEIQAEPTMYVFTFISAFITAYVLGMVVVLAGATSLVGGALVGAVVWIGLGATTSFVKDQFDNPNRGTWLLYGGYQLVLFLVQGAILAVWR